MANQTMAIILDTFREAAARKIFWGLFALSTLMMAFFLFILKIDVVEGATATVTLFGNRGPLGDVERLIRQAQAGIATFLYTWGLFLSVFASAGLIPSVLEPGRIELLLSKPVSRMHLLLGRYLGNLIVVGVNNVYLVLGIWLIFGLKTGLWSPEFLFAIFTSIFLFAVMLAVVLLLGVLFESTALAVMVPTALMLISPVLAQTAMAERLLSSEWSRMLWKGLYHVLPKVYDIGAMTMNFVLERRMGSVLPLATSAFFAAWTLLAAVYVFQKRDF